MFIFFLPKFPRNFMNWLFLGGSGSDSGCYDESTRFSLGFSFQTESQTHQLHQLHLGNSRLKGARSQHKNPPWFLVRPAGKCFRYEVWNCSSEKRHVFVGNSTIFSLDSACSFQEGQVGRAEGSNESFCSTRGDLCASFIINNHTSIQL